MASFLYLHLYAGYSLQEGACEIEHFIVLVVRQRPVGTTGHDNSRSLDRF